MYAVVVVHIRQRGSRRSPAATHHFFFLLLFGFFFFFLQAFTVFQPRMQECKRLLFPTFRNKHWLQMNETVVRFNLVKAWCRATYRGLPSVWENTTNSHTLMAALSFHKVFFFPLIFLHRLHSTTEEGWRSEHEKAVDWRASPQRQGGVNSIDDLISQPIRFKSIANCRLGCSSISYTMRTVTKQNNSDCAILSLPVLLAASWCTSAPWLSPKAPRPWIMHCTFITATKQLMGCALAEMTGGIARCRCAGCARLSPDQFSRSSDGGGAQMRRPMQR